MYGIQERKQMEYAGDFGNFPLKNLGDTLGIDERNLFNMREE